MCRSMLYRMSPNVVPPVALLADLEALLYDFNGEGDLIGVECFTEACLGLFLISKLSLKNERLFCMRLEKKPFFESDPLDSVLLGEKPCILLDKRGGMLNP